MIVHVGRCDPEKNHLRLVDIFADIAARREDARLVLVGRDDTAHAPAVRARIGELGLTSRVHWTGLRDDVPALLNAADVMVFPSHWEGVPGAVLEAAAAGLPTVASSVPGVEEIAPAAPLLRPRTLSLSTPDWADTVLESAAIARETRAGAAQAFARSPFRAEVGAEMLAEVWRRAGSRAGSSARRKLEGVT
jgi:glycosyltransferase involved in cell wall biosynthesis